MFVFLTQSKEENYEIKASLSYVKKFNENILLNILFFKNILVNILSELS